MPLIEADEHLLRDAYDELGIFFITDQTDVNRKNWPSVKVNLIKFCIEHEIRLYDIRTLKFSKATELLTLLVTHFILLKNVSAEDPGWKREALEWKRIFEENLRQANVEFVQLHDEAYLSVGDQYIKTQKVSPTTLLTFNDMVTLFANPDFRTDDLLLSEPFTLDEKLPFLEERIQKLIHENDQDKTLFIPITHQGHWFYLLKQKDVWVIKDSQPFREGDEFSPRQASIEKRSIELIKRLTGSSNPTVTFETTGEQNNDYDCGTQVINAYRTLAARHYVKQTHKNILIELAQSQVLPKEKLPEDIEEIFGPKPVVHAKISGSPKSQVLLKKENSSPIIAEQPIITKLSVSAESLGHSESLVHSSPRVHSSPLLHSEPLLLPDPLVNPNESPAPLAKKPQKIPAEFTKKNFLLLLDAIKEKQRLRLSQFPSANRAVNRLQKRITDAADEFYENEFSVTSLTKFESKCTQAMKAAEEALGSHRDTLGVVFAGIKNFFVVLWKNIAGSSEREHRLKFFDGRTDSAKMLQDLKEDIQAKQDQYREALPSLE